MSRSAVALQVHDADSPVARTEKGALWRCTAGGLGSAGQLGSNMDLNGPTTSNVPVKVAGTQTFVAISAGSEHVCAIDNKAMAWCW